VEKHQGGLQKQYQEKHKIEQLPTKQENNYKESMEKIY